MRRPTLPPTAFHPYDAAHARDPYDALAEARRRCPVMRCAAPGLPDVFVVSRYDDLCAAFRDFRTFGNMGTKTTIEAHDAALATLPGVGELDPPAHVSVRRLLLVAMAPRAVERADPHVAAVARRVVAGFAANVAAVARRVVAGFAANGAADLVREWATPIPSDAIAFVLGLPESDWPMIHAWVASQFTDARTDARTTPTGIGPPSAEFLDYVRDQIRTRRARPSAYDDALARMAAFERPDGTRFDDEELTHHVRTLLTAGNETTTSLMSNAVYRLLTSGAVDQVRRDPALIGPLVEESLRLDPPVQVFNRRVRQPATLAGEALDVDDVVVLSIASGNRDETVWGDDAGEFRVDRFGGAGELPGHLGFGLGAHFCVGATLARMSARHGLGALLEATTDLHLEPGWTYDKVPYHAVRRPRTLPVRFSPATPPPVRGR